MTEAEWLAATGPTPMLRFLRDKASDRKLRLFSCASVRATTFRSEVEGWVQVAEQFADGLIGQDELTVARERRAPMFTPAILVSWVLSSELSVTSEYILPKFGIEAEVATVLLDIFGNPFRPVSVDPSWLTSTVVSLAQGIYQDRAFDRMPILADALQDAGCDNNDVLNHCRQSGEHVRGCWVVDLILGKK